ncbi:MAG TPA: STAS domain-containing protein [Polyangiaceae bacterium]|nr:STAS domain-containing protein [Polyangiaceae bacterium]
MSAGERNRRGCQQDGRGFPRLSLQAVICGSVRTLRLQGELDLASRAVVEDAIARLILGDCTVVLDLRRLTFMDTSGVHVALAANDLCIARGCELRLISGPAAVQRVFDLAGTLARLPFQAEEGHVGPELSGGHFGGGVVRDRLAARAARPRREPFRLLTRRPPLRRLRRRAHGL